MSGDGPSDSLIARLRARANSLPPPGPEAEEPDLDATAGAEAIGRALRGFRHLGERRPPDVDLPIIKPLPAPVIDVAGIAREVRDALAEEGPRAPAHPPVKVVSDEQADRAQELLDNGAPSQRAIQNSTGLSRWKVRRAIGLHAIGFPLAVSDPDLPPMPPGERGVRWPSVEKAQQLLDSGRVQRRR